MTTAAHRKTLELAFPGPVRDALVASVLRGEKTATAALAVEYQRDGERLPSPGDLGTLVDSGGQPVGVVETTEVRVVRMADVDLAFARDEGGGFESVAAWREAHMAYWSSYFDGIRCDLGDPSLVLDDDTLVVAERFRLVERLDR